MNRLLKVQLKKAYGKGFDLCDASDEFNNFIEILNQSYDDFYIERQLLENTLEVNSKELTEANLSLRKSHELLRSVTESIDDAIFYKDLEFKYIGCNWHFSELTNLSSDEIIGKDDFDIFKPEEAQHFRSIDAQLLDNNGPLAIKEWLTDPEGNTHYFSTIKSPLLNAKGEIIGIVGVARDITEQHKMQKELDSKQHLLTQQNRHASMGEMIGNIAHKWRQPLNALGLIIQNIGIQYNRGILNEEKVQTSMDKSMHLIKGMSSTIDDFREFFNPNKKKESFSIREAIDQAHTFVESSLEGHLVEYQLEMSDEIKIIGYKNEFSQVIINLLNNAKDILIEKDISPAKIHITAKKTDTGVFLDVCDNGGGVPESAIEKIFDPYFSTKEEGKGTGIGLYMSKMIIEDHMNGKITVSNKDRGACFTLEF